jgi:FAD/FMN-containing dehydrogenase
VAAASGDVARALLIMQLGLLLTFGIIAGVTIVLIRISLSMTVAAVIGFGATHLAVLALFYAGRARRETALERNAP